MLRAKTVAMALEIQKDIMMQTEAHTQTHIQSELPTLAITPTALKRAHVFSPHLSPPQYGTTLMP